MVDIVTQAKADLIQNVIFSVSKNGAFQRNKIYCNQQNSKNALLFKKYLKIKLIETLEQILKHKIYTDDDHYATIVKFSMDVSKDYKHCFNEEGINIGTAQKLINLFWKMSWLLQNNIPVPIHCPFDGIIIKGLGKEVKNMKWTSIDHIDNYKKLVMAVRTISGDGSIAEWELINYNIGNKITLP